MFAYAGLIRRCMLCSLFVLMDGVLTMRVDFEWQMLVSKQIENPGILQNVRLVAQIITKMWLYSRCCCFAVQYAFVWCGYNLFMQCNATFRRTFRPTEFFKVHSVRLVHWCYKSFVRDHVIAYFSVQDGYAIWCGCISFIFMCVHFHLTVSFKATYKCKSFGNSSSNRQIIDQSKKKTFHILICRFCQPFDVYFACGWPFFISFHDVWC